MYKLENNGLSVSYNPVTKELFRSDKTDNYNLPVFYNATKRSVKKAWENLQKSFNKDTTYRQAINILTTNGVVIKSYCMMD